MIKLRNKNSIDDVDILLFLFLILLSCLVLYYFIFLFVLLICICLGVMRNVYPCILFVCIYTLSTQYMNIHNIYKYNYIEMEIDTI